MNCPFCLGNISNSSKYCCYCGKKVEPEESRAVDFQKSRVIVAVSECDELAWGMHINECSDAKLRLAPTWLQSIQKEDWYKRGVVIWNRKINRVTRLWAFQALQILDQLQNTDDWKEDGIVVGELAYQIIIPLEKSEDENDQGAENEESNWVLTNEIYLSNGRTLELAQFLNQNKRTLEKMVELDNSQAREVRAGLYEYIL